MDLGDRIRWNNIPTFGSVSDEKLIKSAYTWIGQDVPEGYFFFCTLLVNKHGISNAVSILIEYEGKELGTYNITDSNLTFQDILIKS